MDSASNRLRWGGNTLGIEDSLDKERFISGLQAEGNDLSYMIKLLFLTNLFVLLFWSDRSALTPGLPATIDTDASDRPSKRRSARDSSYHHGAVDSVGGFRQARRRSARRRCGRRGLDPSRRDGRAFRAQHHFRAPGRRGVEAAQRKAVRLSSDDRAVGPVSQSLR